jgi:hypothetical protein
LIEEAAVKKTELSAISAPAELALDDTDNTTKIEKRT